MLEWQEINLKDRIIKRAPLKTKSSTGKIVRMYMFNTLYDHLKLLIMTSKGKYVCPHIAELYCRDRGATVSRRIQRFLHKECGIELYRQLSDGRKITEVGFHSFRHHFCTLAEENGVDEMVVKEILGWGSPYMKKIYTHLSDEYIIEQMKKMEETPKSEANSMPPASTSTKDMSSEDLFSLAQSIQEELKRRQKAS